MQIETYMWTSAVSILVAAALVTLETVAYTFTYIDCTVPIRECDVSMTIFLIDSP